MNKKTPKKEDMNESIQVFKLSKLDRNKKIKNWKHCNWKGRRILWVFWNNKYISELYEKWIHHDGNYACTRFEELRTCSGEVLFTNEHKANISREKSKTYIDTDELKMFRDSSSKDTIPLKTKDMDKTIPKTEHKYNK